MRQLKFRYWNTISKKFQPNMKYAIDGNGKLISYDFDLDIYNEPVSLEDTCIAVQQFTGFKDRTGKDIYEGDILVYELSYDEVMETSRENPIDDVIFKDGMFQLGSGDLLMHCCSIKSDTLDEQIIGNIYENPELLKV